MDVNNDELYQNSHNDSESDSNSSVLGDTESERTVFENKDSDQKLESSNQNTTSTTTSTSTIITSTTTTTTTTTATSTFNDTTEETIIDDISNKTSVSASLVDNEPIKSSVELELAANTENIIADPCAMAEGSNSKILRMDNTNNRHDDIIKKENIKEETIIPPTPTYSIFPKTQIKTEITINSHRQLQPPPPQHPPPQNNTDMIMDAREPDAVLLTGEKDRMMTNDRMEEMNMDWNMNMVNHNMGLKSNKDESMDKPTDVNIDSPYVHFPPELEPSHLTPMNNTPSLFPLKNKKGRKAMSLDSSNTPSMMNTSTVNLMSSPFINTKELESTPMLSTPLFHSPGMDAINTLPLSKTTVASGKKKSKCDSITIPSHTEPLNPLTPLSAKDTITPTITPTNSLISSTNGYPTLSGMDKYSLMRTVTPTTSTTPSSLNRSNSLPNPRHTPIVPSSTTTPNNPTSGVFLDRVQVPSHVSSHLSSHVSPHSIPSNIQPSPPTPQVPSQGTPPSHPSLPPSMTTANANNSILLGHPSQAGSPTTLYNPNVLYNGMTSGGMPNMYSIPSNMSSTPPPPPPQAISMPSNLGYPSTLGNVPSNVYLPNPNSATTTTPDPTFQNTNPWLLEFQPMTSPAYQNYPNYHMNSIENSDMEAMNNFSNAAAAAAGTTPPSSTTTTQTLHSSFYYMP
ncbi:hypothetical protein PIROE2DRAFT_63966 [Piromyces sp. E2]|nr:hypothetical protein PIROE2DRAFT_63966 [Piromyces sp. E2]|eukprot:OUM59135.1 hypothetical protein PIROE2DRAFT_63966 [Piromyces sp. E2]